MKKWVLASVLFFNVAYCTAQEVSVKTKTQLEKPYNPKDNAEVRLQELMQQAKKEHKRIILQAGGNWCIWCLRFNDFIKHTPTLQSIVNEYYLYYHLNYSKENKNEAIFKRYGNPGAKYGYPVFLVLDQEGNLLHTQDSAVLEEGKGYSVEKVKAFLERWAIK